MSNKFYIKQGDLWPSLQAYLKQINNDIISLGQTDIVQITIVQKRKPNTPIVNHQNVTIINGPQGLVEYAFKGNETALAGEFIGEFLVKFNGTIPARIPNEGYFDVIITPKLPTS